MKRLAIILLILTSFAVSAHAQKRTSSTVNGRIKPCQRTKLVDPAKPMVYLTFLRRERIETTAPTADQERLYFRLTNNTCWPIWLDMSGPGDARYGEASLYYAIEDKSSGRNVSGTIFCHVCSFNPLPSGKGFTFSIPFREAIDVQLCE
jgi:hypothetical protein